MAGSSSGSLARSRWAGFGAAVAVSLGAGGAGWIVNAASAPAASFVSITPCRLFDTRPDTQIGNRGTPLAAGETLDRAVWGTNGNCTIPNTATAITYNLTVPDGKNGFLTVYPADAALPNASSINPVTGESVKVNGGVVGLSAGGAIKVFTANGPVNVVMDITGYYQIATTGGGPPAPAPAQIVTVATSGGNFTSIKAALASITDNSAAKPYLVKIAPGTYTEPGGIDMKTYVDIEGSGQDTTTITCTCGSATNPTINGSSATLRATGPGLFAELRQLTVNNTGTNIGTNIGTNNYSTGIWTTGIATGQLSLINLAATATGASSGNYGVINISSSPTMSNVTASATGRPFNVGVANQQSSPAMTDVIASATGTGSSNYGVFNDRSSLSMTNLIVGATGGITNSGVYNQSSSVTMTNVRAVASGGTEPTGVSVNGGTVLIRDSYLEGTRSADFLSGQLTMIDTVFNGNTYNAAGKCVNAMTTGLVPYTCL